MKIAFDVNGTLDGKKKDLLISLLIKLQDHGHECIVWSSDFSTAQDYVYNNNLNCEFSQKNTKLDCRNQDIEFVDIAIDDDADACKILGANKVLLVKDLNKSVEEIFTQYFVK